MQTSLPGEQNAAAKAEPIPASLPGSRAGLRLDPIAEAAVNALKTRTCAKILAAAVAKRPACASGSDEGLATTQEHAVKKINKTKTKTD